MYFYLKINVRDKISAHRVTKPTYTGTLQLQKKCQENVEWDELFKESRENSATLLVVSNLDVRINVNTGYVQGKEVSFRLGRWFWGCVLPLPSLLFKS